MSLYDFKIATELAHKDTPFYALIMAAMYRADSENIKKLKLMWPDIWDEAYERYHAPEGIIKGD